METSPCVKGPRIRFQIVIDGVLHLNSPLCGRAFLRQFQFVGFQGTASFRLLAMGANHAVEIGQSPEFPTKLPRIRKPPDRVCVRIIEASKGVAPALPALSGPHLPFRLSSPPRGNETERVKRVIVRSAKRSVTSSFTLS